MFQSVSPGRTRCRGPGGGVGLGVWDGAIEDSGWTNHGDADDGTGAGDGLGRGATTTGANAVAGRTAGVEAGLAETDCCTVAVATIAMRMAPPAARTRARWDGVWSDLKNVFLRALGPARGGWPGAAGIRAAAGPPECPPFLSAR